MCCVVLVIHTGSCGYGVPRLPMSLRSDRLVLMGIVLSLCLLGISVVPLYIKDLDSVLHPHSPSTISNTPFGLSAPSLPTLKSSP